MNRHLNLTAILLFVLTASAFSVGKNQKSNWKYHEKDPVGKNEIVVAAFTGNSNRDRRMKPDIIANMKKIDPDLLFFSGDQSYDHKDHLYAWLLFGRQFGDIIKDRPTICVPDDHDVGQGNLWGAEGRKSTGAGGCADGGYVHPVKYVNEVQFAQTANLPDPYDPTPIQRNIGVYYTSLNVGGVDFAISDHPIQHWPHAPYKQRNDTRAAGGLNQKQVLDLHMELRELVDIGKAPSEREMEIWRQLRRPQWGAWPHEALTIVNGKIKKNGHMSDELWGIGGNCMRYAEHLYRLDDRSYLPVIAQYADVILSGLNDPRTGLTSDEDGARPPVFVRAMPVLEPGEQEWRLHKYLRKFKYVDPDDQAKHDELIARPQYVQYEYLLNGQLLQGILNTAIWILDHPEVHNEQPPQVPGVKFASGATYLEKATSWLLAAKTIFEYFEQQRYFDKQLGVWMEPFDNSKQEATHEQREDGTWEIKYRALPLNRYMIFNHAYLATGIGLNKLDPETHGLWYQRARHVAKRGFDFWREHMVNSKQIKKKHNYPESNKYGLIYYWAYAADGDDTEDLVHLKMEMQAMLGMNRREHFLSDEELKAVANMTFSGLFDYENNGLNKNIFRNTQPENAMVYYTAAPPFGGIIGKTMPDDAYEQFVSKQLELWDKRIAAGKLERADAYAMPFEILKARLNRFGKDDWLNL